MKILYDISVLGFGHTSAISRTGVFRVVEHGVHGLAGENDIQVTFCSSQSNHEQCNSYLSSQPQFASARINPPEDILSRFYSMIEPARLKVHTHDRHPLKNDLVRYLYHSCKSFTKPIADSDIRSADIYYSPSSPIPQQVTRNRKIVPVLTVHDLIPIVYDDTISRAALYGFKKILDSISPETFVLSVSHHTKADLCGYMKDLDPERVKVTPLAAGDYFYHCCDPLRMEAVRKRYGIPDGVKYLLALSTLHPRKNFPRTIKCFVKLLQESGAKDLYLVIAGAKGADFDNILFELEQAKTYRNRIILTGYLPDEDLAPLYSGALSFLYLSLYEGFGLPPLEAMQCGTAVITSNNSSIPEIVGDAALTVDPLDEDAICSAMLQLYSSETLREKLAARSLERAKEFSWGKYNSLITSVFQEAVA